MELIGNQSVARIKVYTNIMLITQYLDVDTDCSLVAQMAKNLPVMQETCVQSLGQEDPLQKGMATHSSILAWRNPWTE